MQSIESNVSNFKVGLYCLMRYVLLLTSRHQSCADISTQVKQPFMAIVARCSLHLSSSRPLRPNVTSSIKPEIHNVTQRRQRRTEPRPQGICRQNFVPIGPAVPEICLRTDRHTDRRVDHNTPHPYRGWGNNKLQYCTRQRPMDVSVHELPMAVSRGLGLCPQTLFVAQTKILYMGINQVSRLTAGVHQLEPQLSGPVTAYIFTYSSIVGGRIS